VEQLLTVKEAAQRLACTEAAIRKWLYQRRLPAVKVGRLVRLREADLEAVIARGVRPRLEAADRRGAIAVTTSRPAR
jgi:excisionase family DNA binding protein